MGVLGIIPLLILLIGWFLNVVKLIKGQNDAFPALKWFRIAGIFFVPIGALLGYFV
jgi:hypothetical protein